MSNQEYIKSICLLGSDRKTIETAKLSEPLSSLIAEMHALDAPEKILHALSLDHYYRLAGEIFLKLAK